MERRIDELAERSVGDKVFGAVTGTYRVTSCFAYSSTLKEAICSSEK
jgi:hypothetical protein